MKGIACTIERVERRIRINIADRNGVRPIKTIDAWKKGGLGSRVCSNYINWGGEMAAVQIMG